MTSPVARTHGWPFWLAALLFGVAAPVWLLSVIGLFGATFGLVDEQAELLVVTACALLLAAAPLGANRPTLAAFAAGGHGTGALMAIALACVAAVSAVQLATQIPEVWLYAAAPWLTAGVFARRAWVLWGKAAGSRRRFAFGLLALLLYVPALGVGGWMEADWRRVRPLLGSAEGADWQATLSRAWWLTRLPAGLKDLELQWDYCDASSGARLRLAVAGQTLFGDDYTQEDCEEYPW